jgi:hypothetical protein
MVSDFIYIRPNGNKYRGYWKDGKQHGEGEFYEKISYIWIKGIWNNGIS